MGFRDSFKKISPPWLAEGLAGGVGYAIGLILDAGSDIVQQGIKARMPGRGTFEALPLIGEAMMIDRGPTEPDASYAARLKKAFDTWRIAGSASAVLTQLRAYFLPTVPANIRLVSNASVWHVIDAVTEVVTKSKPSPANWVWDAFAPSLTATPRWWRFWVVIDGTSRWSQWFWGTSGVTYGDGNTWGSTATRDEVLSIQRIVRRWKAAHAICEHIIITFNSSLFEATDAPGGDMPDGDWDQWLNRSGNAAYWEGVQ